MKVIGVLPSRLPGKHIGLRFRRDPIQQRLIANDCNGHGCWLTALGRLDCGIDQTIYHTFISGCCRVFTYRAPARDCLIQVHQCTPQKGSCSLHRASDSDAPPPALRRLVPRAATSITVVIQGNGVAWADDSFSGMSVMVASVSNKILATETAFSRAIRTTLVGSMMPASYMST